MYYLYYMIISHKREKVELFYNMYVLGNVINQTKFYLENYFGKTQVSF